jgi:hypothetical protein
MEAAVADDLREVARRRNERIGLGPITDPAVLRKVADLIVAWQERQAEGKELQDARLLR